MKAPPQLKTLADLMAQAGHYAEFCMRRSGTISPTLFLIGTTMDYEVKALSSGFTFINPNEKGRCGCGESFHV